MKTLKGKQDLLFIYLLKKTGKEHTENMDHIKNIFELWT